MADSSLWFDSMFGAAKQIIDLLRALGWLGAAIVTIIGAIWVATTYLHSKRIEYQKSFNDKQLEIVFLVAETVGKLTAAREKSDWEEHRERFWELYWGRLVLFESNPTARAMIKLGEKLNSTSFEDRRQLEPDAYQVSLSLRDYLKERNENDWRITIDTLLANNKKTQP